MVFHVYENWVHRYAGVHRSECSFCNHGRGTHGATAKTPAGQWHGPFNSANEALAVARATGFEVRLCSFCAPG